jgi:hypothetical protein
MLDGAASIAGSLVANLRPHRPAAQGWHSPALTVARDALDVRGSRRISAGSRCYAHQRAA